MDTDLPDFSNVDPKEPVAFLDATHANAVICGTAALLRAKHSFSVVAPSPTDAKHSPLLLPAPLKLSSLPLSRLQSMLAMCKLS